MTMQNRILRDIKVLDFTRLLPGPLAAEWLAEAGADVLKVEDPDYPDGIRLYSQGPFEKARLYETLNRSKTLWNKLPLGELKNAPEFLDILAKADVLLEQFKPGFLKKVGLDYESLSELNPRLVYVSLSGFGPERPEPGHDLNFVAESGLLYQLRDAGGKPVMPRFQLGDVAGSYACYAAVLEGLLERSFTGKGSLRELSMASAVLPFGTVPHRFAEAGLPHMADFLAGAIPNYNVYACADGEYVALAALEPHLWHNAAEAFGYPESLRAAYNNPAMLDEVRLFFAGGTSENWLAKAEGKNTCLSPVCRPGDARFNRLNEGRLVNFSLPDGGTAQGFVSPFSGA